MPSTSNMPLNRRSARKVGRQQSIPASTRSLRLPISYHREVIDHEFWLALIFNLQRLLFVPLDGGGLPVLIVSMIDTKTTWTFSHLVAWTCTPHCTRRKVRALKVKALLPRGRTQNEFLAIYSRSLSHFSFTLNWCIALHRVFTSKSGSLGLMGKQIDIHKRTRSRIIAHHPIGMHKLRNLFEAAPVTQIAACNKLKVRLTRIEYCAHYVQTLTWHLCLLLCSVFTMV